METVGGFKYLCDSVIAGGGYEAILTARTRCAWVKYRECGELLYGKSYPLKLKWFVYKNYVQPAILHGSESWFLKESEMGIVRVIEISLVREVSRVQFKDRKRTKHLMLVLDLNVTVDRMVMENDSRWHGHVLRIEDGCLQNGIRH